MTLVMAVHNLRIRIPILLIGGKDLDCPHVREAVKAEFRYEAATQLGKALIVQLLSMPD